uniref:plant UBX domain-containing protein 7-like isoform X2 n=1 Tax=Erigeron canadensis TaxID=72917 RepID=UPI001CB9116E|nr:plant UBX domain-containing protein 7-like isoform X2 [Erigeron canadensis]
MERDDVGLKLTAAYRVQMVASFLEIAVGQTHETARQFLQATNWQLEEAIQLFYLGNEVDGSCTLPPDNDVSDQDSELDNQTGFQDVEEFGGSEIRAPLPVKRDILYDSPVLYSNSDEKSKGSGVWGADQGSTSRAETSKDNLASLYRSPFALMYRGSFEEAKEAASGKDRWLIVNVQSTREFSSHMLNRDTWANEAVVETITNNFVFWQVADDAEEGSKISTYYKLDSYPVTLVIDPITGQKMRLWRGMVQPDCLLEDLLLFMDASPKDHHFSLSHNHSKEIPHTLPSKTQDETNEDDEELKLAHALSMGTINDNVEVSLKGSDAVKEVSEKEKCTYPPLPEEPQGDRNSLCRIRVRLPDGRSLQRNFLRSDPIQLLWSYCAANCGEEKQFRLTHAIPGAMKDMEYGSTLTFEESGVANSMISVTWE